MQGIKELKSLDIHKRIDIWHELWASILQDVDIPITKEEKKILDHRYQHYKNNPSSGKSWENIYNELKTSS